MPQSLSKIYVHIVFSTKNRENLISPLRVPELHSYIAEVFRKNQAEAYRIGGTENHVHIASMLPKTMSIAKLVEIVKSTSSKWMKSGKNHTPHFQWQDGYGAFSVSQSHLSALFSYIENQELHHREVSYEEEVRGISERYCD